MRSRCYRKKDSHYHRYGGRGIKVCDEWLGRGGFVKFLAHIGPKPSPDMTVERKNNDLNYEPGNVRWATRKEQSQNTSATRLTPAIAAEIRNLRGSLSKNELADRYGVSRDLIRAVLIGKTW